jgi:signal transduction histidine kinase
MSTTINQDLQATHRILTLLEKSKSNSESVLDILPGIFCVINEKGEVLRGNEDLSLLYNCTHEELFRQSFSSLFKHETWNIFKCHFNNLINSEGKLDKIEFELSIQISDDELERPHFWYVSEFKTQSSSEGKLFTVIGRDITELRESEKQLMEIFSSIPLGILTVNKDGNVEGQYSSYTEYLLEETDLREKNIEILLFARASAKMNQKELQGVRNLLMAIGENELIYDSLQGTFPKQICLASKMDEDDSDLEKYLGITYQPVVYEGTVRSLLIIVENRTEIVKAERAQEKAKLLEDQSIARIIQIKKSDPTMLPMFMSELKNLFDRVDEVIESEDERDLCNILHSVKGNGRVAGFEYMTDLTHKLEADIMQKESQELHDGWDFVIEAMTKIKKEWHELLSLYKSLFPEESASLDESTDDQSMQISKDVQELFIRYNSLICEGYSPETALISERILLALQSINFSPIKTLEQLIGSRVDQTAAELGKKVQVEYEWDGVSLDESCKQIVSDSLLHLINNALDHGIENKQLRELRNKSLDGKIRISAKEKFGLLNIVVEDDGGGVDLERVKNRILKNKLLTLDEVMKVSDEDLMQFIFRPSFSTAENVSEISGRGIGLDAVAMSIKKMGGSVSIESEKGVGSKFLLTMRSGKSSLINRSCISLKSLTRSLINNIYLLADQENFELEIDEKGIIDSFRRGVLFADPSRLLLSITTFLGYWARTKTVKVNFTKKDDGLIEVTFQKTGKQESKQKSYAEFELPLVACRDYVNQHGGTIEEDGDTLILNFGMLLINDQIPNIVVGLGAGVSEKTAQKTIDRINELKVELDLPLNVDAKSSDEANILINSSGQRDDFTRLSLTAASSKKNLQKELLNAVELMLGINE